MEGLSKSQRGRHAIRTIKVLADSVMLQGGYKPSGTLGEKLADALKQLSPEIYGSMNDANMTELQGLSYVIDRMPRGIEECSRIILTAQEDFKESSFEKIIPLKRRRVSYAVSEKEICFVITTGKSEVYDILTHITFLHLEAQKLFRKIDNRAAGVSSEWRELERLVKSGLDIVGAELEQAIWNLSIILGRTYKETRETYEYLEQGRQTANANNGLFAIIYGLGSWMQKTAANELQELSVYCTPSLLEMIDNQKYASLWADQLKTHLIGMGLSSRPVHIISANMHSMRNLIYGAAALQAMGLEIPKSLYDMVRILREHEAFLVDYAGKHGFTYLGDSSGSTIDVNIIDMEKLDQIPLHQAVSLDLNRISQEKPVLVILDYAFGTQAHDIMDELLKPFVYEEKKFQLPVDSISIMGKAGVLPGKKGDIMLASSYVMEGTANNYMVQNDLLREDFPKSEKVYVGPMLTVLGTSLQNRDVLERFHSSSWGAVGLEMEGGHYQRAISGATIQGHIPPGLRTRYAYYASDNPMISGETLASGPMGDEGIVPTYLITKIILMKIAGTRES